jgi:hypothetical protein
LTGAKPVEHGVGHVVTSVAAGKRFLACKECGENARFVRHAKDVNRHEHFSR